MAKVTKTITIDKDVWDNARKSGFNISGEIQKYLETIIGKDVEVMNKLSYCSCCGKQKDLKKMYLLLPDGVRLDIEIKNYERPDNFEEYFMICPECLKDVKHNRANEENVVVCIAKACIKEEERILARNKDPELIERVRKREVRFHNPFENAIGCFDNGDEYNSLNIKNLLNEITTKKPLADWIIEKGYVKVPCKDIYDDWEGE